MTTMASGDESCFKSVFLPISLFLCPVLSSVIYMNPFFCFHKIEIVKILLVNNLKDAEFINRAWKKTWIPRKAADFILEKI